MTEEEQGKFNVYKDIYWSLDKLWTWLLVLGALYGVVGVWLWFSGDTPIAVLVFTNSVLHFILCKGISDQQDYWYKKMLELLEE